MNLKRLLVSPLDAAMPAPVRRLDEMIRRGRAAELSINGVLRNYGLTRRDFRVLVGAAERPGLIQRELADWSGVDRSTIVDITQRLKALDLLTCRLIGRGRPGHSYEATRSGRNVIQRVARELLAGIEHDLSEDPGRKRAGPSV